MALVRSEQPALLHAIAHAVKETPQGRPPKSAAEVGHGGGAVMRTICTDGVEPSCCTATDKCVTGLATSPRASSGGVTATRAARLEGLLPAAASSATETIDGLRGT